MPVKGGVMSPAEKGRSFPPPNPASYSVPGLLPCDHAGVHRLPTREEPAIPPETLAGPSLPGDLVRTASGDRRGHVAERRCDREQRAASTVQSVVALREWLSAQGCVQRESVPIDSGRGVNALLMLTTDPALVPISIVFRTEVKAQVFSRLLLAVDAPAGLKYVRSDARAVVNAVAKQRQSRGRIMRIAAATLLTIASTAAFFVLERTELAGAGPVALPGRHHAAEGP